MFGIDRLRALDALESHGTVAGAAAALHMTPSGVSQQIAKLEREAGSALTEPAGRGLRLTPAGRVLAEHAAAVLARMSTARADLERLRDEVVGPLRLGAIPTSVHALAPATLARLRAAHPDVRVSLTDGEAEQTLPAVLTGDLDVAIVENWDGLPSPAPSGTARARLCDDVVDLALPATHRLADRDRVAIGEVDDVDWVADGGGTRAQAWLVQTLRAHDLEPRVTCTVCGFGMHLELAGAGVAALVPRLARPPVPAGVRMVATAPTLRRTIDAVWRRDRETPVVRAAVATLREVAAATSPAAKGQGEDGRHGLQRGSRPDAPSSRSSVAAVAGTGTSGP